MLDGGHGGFEFVFVERFVAHADVLNQKAKWNVFGEFDGAFDFVHGFDAASAVDGRDVQRWSAGASPLVIGVERRVDRVERHAAGTEPIGDFLHMLFAIGVVKMLAGGENFDRLRAAAYQAVQQAGMQSLFYVNES